MRERIKKKEIKCFFIFHSSFAGGLFALPWNMISFWFGSDVVVGTSIRFALTKFPIKHRRNEFFVVHNAPQRKGLACRSSESPAAHSQLNGASTITFEKKNRTAIYQRDREPSSFSFLLRFRRSFIGEERIIADRRPLFSVFILEMRIRCVANFLPFLFLMRFDDTKLMFSVPGEDRWPSVRVLCCVRSWFCSHSVNRPHIFFRLISLFHSILMWHEYFRSQCGGG